MNDPRKERRTAETNQAALQLVALAIAAALGAGVSSCVGGPVYVNTQAVQPFPGSIQRTGRSCTSWLLYVFSLGTDSEQTVAEALKKAGAQSSELTYVYHRTYWWGLGLTECTYVSTTGAPLAPVARATPVASSSLPNARATPVASSSLPNADCIVPCRHYVNAMLDLKIIDPGKPGDEVWRTCIQRCSASRNPKVISCIEQKAANHVQYSDCFSEGM